MLCGGLLQEGPEPQPMQRRSAAVAGLVLSLALAGCTGLGGSDTPTITPAPLPEPARGTTVAPTLAPGLTADGIENASRLTRAHFGHLQNTAYTAESRKTVRGPDGDVRRRRTEVFRIAGNGTTSQVVSIDRPDPESNGSLVESWRNRTRVMFAITSDGETDYIVRSGGAYGRRLYGIQSTVPESQQLFFLLRSVETRSAERTGNGTIRVTGQGLVRPKLFAGTVRGTDIGNLSLTMTVTPDGLVLSYDLRYEAEQAGTRVRVHRQLRNRNIGSTTVPPPAWYDAAIRAAAERNGTIRDAGFT